MSEKYETIVPSEPDAGERLQWVSWLRSAAPYVHLHHGRTFVISFAGEVVADRTLLNHLVMDVSLIASMGMRVVLVHGSRPQIEELMGLRKLEGQFYKGVRITGPQELECVKEACGETRFDIEAAFSQGLPNTPMQHSRIKVVSGNFVTARPMGIIDGVDYLHTGVVRKVDAESIQDLLSRGNIVLVSPTGFSPTGEAFNLTTEDVATAIAVAIHADKLILSVGVDGVRVRGEKQQDLTAQQAQALIQSKQVDDEDVYNLGYALRAIKGGVDRVHIVPYAMDGGILTELFTHDGVGTMISTENMESLREATIDDVAAIVKLLEPFEAEGILVKRPREKSNAKSVTSPFSNTTASSTVPPHCILTPKPKSGRWQPWPFIRTIKGQETAIGYCAASNNAPEKPASSAFSYSPRERRIGLSNEALKRPPSKIFRLKSSGCITGIAALRFL